MMSNATKALRTVVRFWALTAIDMAILDAVHRAFRAVRSLGPPALNRRSGR